MNSGVTITASHTAPLDRCGHLGLSCPHSDLGVISSGAQLQGLSLEWLSHLENAGRVQGGGPGEDPSLPEQRGHLQWVLASQFLESGQEGDP